MKKQFYKLSTVFILAVGAIAFGQQREGVVGINTESPQATLEVKPSQASNTNEGIIIPKLTKGRVASIANSNLVEGTLVYVTDASYTGGNAKVSGITAKGFYYYDGNNWVKSVGGSSAAGGSNIYSGDGALTEDRTIDQAGNDLTFTTGTGGSTVINGVSKLLGGSYVHVKRLEDGTSYTVNENDYYLSVDGPTNQFKIYIPNPEDAVGRVFIISNKTSGNVVLNLEGNIQALNGTQNANVAKNRGQWIISDGKKWYNLINF